MIFLLIVYNLIIYLDNIKVMYMDMVCYLYIKVMCLQKKNILVLSLIIFYFELKFEVISDGFK